MYYKFKTINRNLKKEIIESAQPSKLSIYSFLFLRYAIIFPIAFIIKKRNSK